MTGVFLSVEALRALHDRLVAAEPKLRMRDRAQRLGVSEAELVAADCGLQSIELGGMPPEIFQQLGTLGEVMALSRNAWCVHERHGRYEDIQVGKTMGIVLGPDIDLRMFFSSWRHAYAVMQGGRSSLQFFDREGVAVHKVYRTEPTDGAAWQALVERFARPSKSAVQPESIEPSEESADAQNPAALREHWKGLRDTHSFHPMLRKFRVSRLGALRAAGTDLAQQVDSCTVVTMLQAAAVQQIPIMCFVGNRGAVQIHSGPVKRLVQTGKWFNVLDPRFNLHLDTSAIHSCWVVNKPTDDGWVTSLEAYEAGGELIVQFFGARKPGVPELPAWRALAAGLCAEPLAA